MAKPTYNQDKALHAVLYVANRVANKDFHKIFKVLYFADMEHMVKYARPITGDTYIAMEYGPVPSNIYDLFKSVRGDGYRWPAIEEMKKLFTVENKYFITPLDDANLQMLSKTDIEELQSSIDTYGGLSWDEIIEKSHAFAWSHTEANCSISIEDMLKEKGEEDDYISYVTSLMDIQKRCI